MKSVFLFLTLLLLLTAGYGQVLINEASNSNYTQIVDSDYDNPDWIELYNAGPDQNMTGYYLSDSKSDLNRWPFPSVSILQNKWMVLFASGKGNTRSINHWETAVKDNDTWKWLNPDASTLSTWKDLNYDDANWNEGQGGFGFGDNDDVTTFASSKASVYTRINFAIADTSIISAAVLHMDYDDGFVAYLNGQEIARSNVSSLVSWNTAADDAKEAKMFEGLRPDEFRLDMSLIKSVWAQGNNVLAVHVMNESVSLDDITSRAFLSFGIENTTKLFRTPPVWFNLQPIPGNHTNFKIDGKGETIYLSLYDNILDSLVIPKKMPLNSSYGRAQDGITSKGIFLHATPGTSNNIEQANINGQEEIPTVDLISGFYSSSVLVSIGANSSGAKIRYTLNGQTPNENGNLYTEPLTLNKSAVLVVRAFSTTGKLPSETVTHSYFINETQTNAGVLSIISDDKNLFGDNGIYDNWWLDWKRPCYIEYFAPKTHEIAFQQRAGLRIDGGAGGSRSHPQHSFRVEPGNGTLGDGSLKYPLIPSRPSRKKYETFYLRNGSNQYLYYPCKDAIETKCLASGTSTPYSAYTPVQVYLNGRYWGWYELREKQDADYFLQNYNIDKDSLELLGASFWYGGALRSIEGKNAFQNFSNDYNAIVNLSTSSQTYWEDADRYFDLPNYIDYICMESWIGNTDWPSNNIKIFRGPQTKNRWRFGVIDVEWALQPNGWTDMTFDHISFMKNYAPGNAYLSVWQKSMENKTFKANFINRFADLMNTKWLKDSLRTIANNIYHETRPELLGEFGRWGNSANIPGQMAAFDAAHQAMLNALSYRSIYVRRHIVNNFSLQKQVDIILDVVPQYAGKIRISTVTPSVYPWKGIYFDGVPVSIEAIANPGYTFANWDDNSLLTSIYDNIFSGELKASNTFRANFQEDALTTKLTISEVNYNPSETMDAGEWVEFWNYSNSFPVDISGWYFTDEEHAHRYSFPENTILNANSGIVVANDTLKFKTIYPNISPLGNFDFSLGNSGDAIRLYNPNDSLIAQVVYDDSTPWPTGADGTGKTLELKAPNMPLGYATSWFAGCVGGSPANAFDSPCKIITAIEPDMMRHSCTLYPNPTHEKVMLSSPTDPVSISVIDFSGRVIYFTTTATLDHEIDMTDYSQGIYLIKIFFKNSTQQTLKVAKY
jgi:hypothetical protein